MLPTITFGGETFYDVSDFVVPDHEMGGIREVTNGLGIHHSVAQTKFPDLNSSGSSIDEVLAHIKAIDEYHISKGYGGFGYNAAVDDFGTVYVVDWCRGIRAHIAYRNWELASICMLGTFTKNQPSTFQVAGTARWVRAMWAEYGVVPVQGHGSWAVRGWESDCPGEGGRLVIPRIIELATNPPEEEEDVPQFNDETVQELLGLIEWRYELAPKLDQVFDKLGVRAPKRYTVQPGDTLGRIAAEFQVSSGEIAAANGIQNPNLISIGQVLTIPV